MVDPCGGGRGGGGYGAARDYLSFDASTTGSSRVATPGKAGDAFAAGDWMIRLEADRPKSADALNGS